MWILGWFLVTTVFSMVVTGMVALLGRLIIPGSTGSLHLLAAVPDPFLIEHIYLDLEAYPFGELNKPDGNAFRVPDGPGLGADPDPEVLKDYLVTDA